jgi:hypothetical protein
VQVLQAATDQSSDQTADGAAYGTADTGSPAQPVLWGFVADAIGMYFTRTARRNTWAWRRRWLRIFGVVSI